MVRYERAASHVYCCWTPALEPRGLFRRPWPLVKCGHIFARPRSNTSTLVKHVHPIAYGCRLLRIMPAGAAQRTGRVWLSSVHVSTFVLPPV